LHGALLVGWWCLAQVCVQRAIGRNPNGIKYAPPGTDVVVTARADRGSVVVSVEDRGRGIAEADLPFIFDEFFQAPERSEPGAGLGLAIARELTEAHGGRIDVASRVGDGTCFSVTLPTIGDGS
jgi:two-component system sensor histidine kinase BaeS